MDFKKYFFVIIIASAMVFAGCYINNDKKLPLIGISVRIVEKGADYCKLEWEVENKSDVTATFLNGNIEQYEVRNRTTKKEYTHDKNEADVILKSGDRYSNNVLINNVEKGSYDCTFWAESEEGTKGAMKLSFEIE
ncbi:hypothetical protein [Desulfotomaculum sp. 1211_IL3151]|uniref:hypothetical protein n=1 Tax=Desulfotomaculum sp. 1211_IL3151 TaxID=3084055 RepID=UPI002FD88D09